MVKLFIYGASEIDKKSPNYYIDKYDEVLDGFREALKELNPPSPFLIRGLFGDYEYKENPHRIIALNTFDKKNLSQLILDILQHGHDRIDNRKGLDYYN